MSQKIYSGICMPKITEKRSFGLTKLLQKLKGCDFLGTECIYEIQKRKYSCQANQHIDEPKYICYKKWAKLPSLVCE